MNRTTSKALNVTYVCNGSDAVGDLSLLSAEDPIRFLEGVAFPIFLLIGTAGNVLNVLVLGKGKTRASADVFVISMAISDLCILWLFIPIWLKKIDPSLITEFHAGFRQFDVVYREIYKWLTSTFYFISDWIAIAFSMERLIVLSHPMKFLGRNTAKKAMIVVGIITFLGIVKPVQLAFDVISWQLSSDSADHLSIYQEQRTESTELWSDIHEIIMLADRFLGFSTLLITNLILTYFLHHLQQSRIRELNQEDQFYHLSRTNILARGCAIQCLIFKFPGFIYNALLLASQPPFCSYHFAGGEGEYWLAFVSFFLMVNTSINFYLYCAFSRNFQKRLEARFPMMVARWRSIRWHRLRGSSLLPKSWELRMAPHKRGSGVSNITQSSSAF
ncbi:hypothetical protein BV898_01467 [Hypsibius exemplaris]|uniref:G-protein coupled receptors family 1 profile domain-containing protein n=1 Tax=Hypsibius exemplaris TaxID=2072580 RepID=A0A1W0XC21_HYPEX|nr:hypothetical protein BV898_01467 [Hypsibius exemplaris]